MTLSFPTTIGILSAVMESYLDWAATAVPDPEICSRCYQISTEFYGNPSSVHKTGQKARELLEEARERCAAALGVKSGEIIFTSGGTESNNMLLLSYLRKPSRGTVLISAIEHPAVLEPAAVLAEAGYKVRFIKPDTDGVVRVRNLSRLLDDDVRLVSVMAVNNETGAVQPVKELAEAVKSFAAVKGRKIHFHCDAVQGTGKVEIDFADPNISSFSISAHKLRGPRGAGILVLKNNIQPVVRGGGQENGLRPGTENIPAIYGLTLALEKAMGNLETNREKGAELSDYLLERLTEKGYTVIPENRKPGDRNYSPFIVSAAVLPVPAEVMARTLDDMGFRVGTGSACSNRKKGQSKTLEAMRVPDDISYSRIRISIGETTTKEEITAFTEALDKASKILRQVTNG